ncbi:hypothetical protein DFH07DRAFT_1061144 [Mycena maculata]|uniref:Uncharacterized protein n=1 Tax=Mycena maculata TaxID=230809 RepID=A0AAD7J2S2_9AGAR|nr:hypothetical protein DFH07DRAFT_1061144 [Mycena maculata]
MPAHPTPRAQPRSAKPGCPSPRTHVRAPNPTVQNLGAHPRTPNPTCWHGRGAECGRDVHQELPALLAVRLGAARFQHSHMPEILHVQDLRRAHLVFPTPMPTTAQPDTTCMPLPSARPCPHAQALRTTPCAANPPAGPTPHGQPRTPKPAQSSPHAKARVANPTRQSLRGQPRTANPARQTPCGQPHTPNPAQPSPRGQPHMPIPAHQVCVGRFACTLICSSGT